MDDPLFHPQTWPPRARRRRRSCPRSSWPTCCRHAPSTTARLLLERGGRRPGAAQLVDPHAVSGRHERRQLFLIEPMDGEFAEPSEPARYGARNPAADPKLVDAVPRPGGASSTRPATRWTPPRPTRRSSSGTRRGSGWRWQVHHRRHRRRVAVERQPDHRRRAAGSRRRPALLSFIVLRVMPPSGVRWLWSLAGGVARSPRRRRADKRRRG